MVSSWIVSRVIYFKDHIARFFYRLIRRTILPIRLQEKLKKLTCLIYLPNCIKCRNFFCYRSSNYRSNSRRHAHGKSCMQEHLHDQFCDSKHSGFHRRLNNNWQNRPYQRSSKRKLSEAYLENIYTIQPLFAQLLLLLHFLTTIVSNTL